MMHQVPRTRLTALAVAGPVVQRGVRPHSGRHVHAGNWRLQIRLRTGNLLEPCRTFRVVCVREILDCFRGV